MIMTMANMMMISMMVMMMLMMIMIMMLMMMTTRMLYRLEPHAAAAAEANAPVVPHYRGGSWLPLWAPRA